MAPRYSLNRPHPDHQPTVGRVAIGMTPTAPSRTLYGTTLRCSCGWEPGWRLPAGQRRQANCISNDAPSRGGRVRAREWYVAHLVEVEENPDLLRCIWQRRAANTWLAISRYTLAEPGTYVPSLEYLAQLQRNAAAAYARARGEVS